MGEGEAHTAFSSLALLILLPPKERCQPCSPTPHPDLAAIRGLRIANRQIWVGSAVACYEGCSVCQSVCSSAL